MKLEDCQSINQIWDQIYRKYYLTFNQLSHPLFRKNSEKTGLITDHNNLNNTVYSFVSWQLKSALFDEFEEL